MKSCHPHILSLILLTLAVSSFGQSVAINDDGSSPDPSAILDIKSTDQGVLIPRMDSMSRMNITAPANGLMVYDSTTNSFWFFNQGWKQLSGIDSDWYLSKTAQTGGNHDDIYHMGNVAIGLDSAMHPLSISSDSSCIVSITSGASAQFGDTIYGEKFSFEQDNFGTSIGRYLQMSSDTLGRQIGAFNEINGLWNTGEIIGGLNRIHSNSVGGQLHGQYNHLTGNSMGFNTGTYNRVEMATSGWVTGTRNIITVPDTGSANLVEGMSNTLSIDGDMYRTTGITNGLYGDGNGEYISMSNNMFIDGDGERIGVRTVIGSEGVGNRYGLYQIFNGPTSDTVYSMFNNIHVTGNGMHYGIHHTNNEYLNASSTGGYFKLYSDNSNHKTHHGLHVDMSGEGDGDHFGIRSSIDNTGGGTHYGIHNTMDGNSSGQVYGMYNNLKGTSTTFRAGISQEFELSGSGSAYGLQNYFTGDDNGTRHGVSNTLGGTGSGTQYCVYNLVSNSGDGSKLGVVNYFTSSGSGLQRGVDNTLLSTGNGDQMGIRNHIDNNTSSASIYGIYSSLQGDGDGERHGVYQEITGSGDGIHYGTRSNLSTNGSGTHYGSYNLLTGAGSGSQYGYFTTITNSNSSNIHIGGNFNLGGSGNGQRYGVRTSITSNGNGQQYGTYNGLSGTGSGGHFGTYNLVEGAGTGNHFGTYQLVKSIGAGTLHGSVNTISGNNTGIQYGNYNNLNGDFASQQYGGFFRVVNDGDNPQYGTYNYLAGTGSGLHTGVKSELVAAATGAQCGFHSYILNSGNGTHYGILNQLAGAGSGVHYGAYNAVTGEGDGPRYGTYNFIGSDGSGTHIAGYFDAPGGSNDYAAIFNTGNVVVNESGGGFYFRVEGITEPNALVVNAGLDNNVGIGTDSPSSDLEIVGTDNTDAIEIDNGKVRLRHHFDLIASDRDYMHFLIDANDDQTDAIFALYKDTDQGLIVTPSVKFGLDNQQSWFNGGGNFGINNTNPLYPLHMASGARVTAGGVWTNASDIAKKTDISELNYGLAEVMRLLPKSYKYKADDSPSIGFIAQEIETVIPEVVSGEDGDKGVAYGLMTAVLVKAVQEQQSEIDELKALLEQQAKMIEVLMGERTEAANKAD